MTRHVFASRLILLLATFSASGLAQDAQPGSEAPELSVCRVADQLYREGKFQEAAVKYDAALRLNNKLEPAQAGMAKTLLGEGYSDAALKTIIAAIDAQ